ncbi:TPA: hypothetical protein ACGO3A_002234 [Streptococcus suis]
MTYYTFNAIEKTALRLTKIKSFKVTSIKELYWNDMEGQNYQINIKMITEDGYKNKLLKVLTNSSYLEDFEGDNLAEELEDYFNGLLYA